MMTWTPDSWQQHHAAQQARYDDPAALQDALRALRQRPPLVTPGEIRLLQAELAAAAAGECFVLQGGDCAESFAECRDDIITNRLRVLLQMSLVLTQGLKQRLVRVGRFAGQYAKPRSADTETRDGVSLPSFRGDLVNAPEFTPQKRRPDPQRLLQAHACSALSLNHVRALIDSGFADLHHPHAWNLDWMNDAPQAASYQALVDDIERSVSFFETLSGQRIRNLDRVRLFASHEALHLPYESALTRPGDDGRHYNLGTHLPWIGMRTAQLDQAHVEYCRGLANPIGIKLGPGMTTDWLQGLLDTLDPDRVPGRLLLIHRFGHDKIATGLPPLIEQVRNDGRKVVWLCDPMHGNTTSTAHGRKTRDFGAILDEVMQSFRIHRECGSRLGGVHLELTGENVTECTGGARALSADDLERCYQSQVDPRLNGEQALELALAIASQA